MGRCCIFVAVTGGRTPMRDDGFGTRAQMFQHVETPWLSQQVTSEDCLRDRLLIGKTIAANHVD
jgi:hypothetical protein